MTQKALRIETAPGTALVHIVWEGGGQKPAMLEGMFTSTTAAREQIQQWENKEQRGVEVVDSTLKTAAEEPRRGPGRPPKAT